MIDLYQTKYFDTTKSPAWIGKSGGIVGYQIQVKVERGFIYQRHIWFYDDGHIWPEDWIDSYTRNVELATRNMEKIPTPYEG
jgi:hypothetical protein